MKLVLIQDRFGEIVEKHNAIISLKLRPYVYLVLMDNFKVRKVRANIFSGVLFIVV